jgi:hypothetical protein
MEDVKKTKTSYLGKRVHSQLLKKIERMELDLRTIKRIVTGIFDKSKE